MDTKGDSADMNEKMGDGSDGKPKFNDSLATASKLPVLPDDPGADPTGSLTDVTLFSELISTEDTDLSPTDTSVNVSPKATETNVRHNPKGGVAGAPPRSPVERDQPRPLCALLPSSAGASCAVCDLSRSFTPTGRSQESLKATRVHAEPDGDDLCAAILLACLFCHPLDCLLAATRGCNECAWSLCSFLCGCEPGTLRPLLGAAGPRWDLCDCLCACRHLCDCSSCDVCLQASECLDLSMEISQMLYH